MKKSIVLFVALLAAGSALFAAPAAQTSQQMLAAEIFSPAEQPSFRSACQASVNCYCGGVLMATLSCTGNVSCTTGPISVTCDGHRYSCLSIDCNPQAP
jgi:hypothetical protein